MNPLLRGTLYGVGLALPIWALILAFFTDWWPVVAAVGMVLLIVGGAHDWVTKMAKPIRELHKPVDEFADGVEVCFECGNCWPCETAKLIYSTEELSDDRS